MEGHKNKKDKVRQNPCEKQGKFLLFVGKRVNFQKKIYIYYCVEGGVHMVTISTTILFFFYEMK